MLGEAKARHRSLLGVVCERAGRDAEHFRCFRCLDISPLLQGRTDFGFALLWQLLLWQPRRLGALHQSGKGNADILGKKVERL